jgi:hypothetical protein
MGTLFSYSVRCFVCGRVLLPLTSQEVPIGTLNDSVLIRVPPHDCTKAPHPTQAQLDLATIRAAGADFTGDVSSAILRTVIRLAEKAGV